jgi:diguanylate cyclase (GGDEF)-like protein/PAS domain S-box-containing protein
MTSSQPNGSPREALAREWAFALSATAYLPMSVDEIERRLAGLVDGMADDLAAGRQEHGYDTAAMAGATMVAVNASGERSLLSTVELLGAGLSELPELAEVDDLPSAVLSTLGSLAAGYAEALRRRTFDQQEGVKQTLERLARQSEARFRDVFTTSAVGIAISELDGTLTQTNLAFAEILGYFDGELAGRDLHELFSSASGDHLRLAYQDIVTGRIDRFRLERPMLRKDGDEAWVFLSVSALRDEHGAATHHVSFVEDITDMHLLQVQLNNQALHDVLTGLPNRQSFALKLESTLGLLDPATTITLFHLDVDSFSVINGGLGHELGDRLLRLVAQRLQAVFAGEKAIIARIAGDEFAVLVENSPSTPNVAAIAARINEELGEPAYLDGIGLAVSASIGVVQRPAGGIGPAELLRQSDATLRRAKGNGKRQWAIFDQQQDAHDRARFTRAAGMPGALENGEFRLEYQPLVRLADQRPVAVEALIRWDHPERGPLGHDEVVELSEQTGMVLPIGEWMLRAACDQAVAWRDRFGDDVPPMTLNLATAQANDPDLVARVREVLATAGLPAPRLQLGLPIRALLCEEGDAEDNLQVLADMGVQTSIHGFGGGHGGLVFLEDLPVRAVRIAGWLVQRLAERPDSVTGRALTDLISLVHTFDASVVIAGVQTREQADWWRKIGADVACGEWFAKPGPPETVAGRVLG